MPKRFGIAIVRKTEFIERNVNFKRTFFFYGIIFRHLICMSSPCQPMVDDVRNAGESH